MSKFFKAIGAFFRPLQTKNHAPNLDRTYDPGGPMGTMMNSFNSVLATLTPRTIVTEDQHRKNLEQIELARLEQERESINNNLAAQHRVLVVTLIATFIALLSSVSAIFIAINQDQPKPPIVNVSPSQPDVKVYLPESKPQEIPTP